MGMCGNRHEDGAAAPVLGNQLILAHLLLYTVHIGAGLIDLINRYDDLNTSGLCMVNGLYRLGHYTVIGSNNQDRNIRSLGAAHTHGGKRLMARRI